MNKKTNKKTEHASFSMQKSPLILELEKKLSALQKKKKQLNTRLRQSKTKLRKFKEEILDIQNQLSVKINSRLNDIENLRKEIISLCQKLAKSKKISKLERKEIKELEKDFSNQRFFPEEMEEFARQRNAGKENEQGFNFFKKFSVEPQELERRDIRKIYLRLADQFHPDRSRTTEQNEHFHELMKSINEAYKSYDVETLLSIEAEYSNGGSVLNAGKSEPDYAQKLEKNIGQISKEIEFLKSQSKRATQEMKRLKKSEPGQMILKKQQAEKEGIDGFEALTADIEMGFKHLSAVKEALEKGVKEGTFSNDVMASLFTGDFGDIMIDNLMEGFKQEFGAELEEEGLPDEVVRKIMGKMVHAQMMGEEEPDMEEIYEIFMDSMMEEEGFPETLMESMMENNFTEVFTPSPKTTKKRNKTKKNTRGQSKKTQAIWTFKIELLLGNYAEDDWQATVEIDSSSTLEEFHFAIQDAVEFNNDHLYEFYISRTERSRNRVRFDDENKNIYSTTLESLYPLEKGTKLYYMFDYGDGWLFKITKSRKSPHEPRKNIKYPRVVDEVGSKPEQYPTLEE